MAYKETKRKAFNFLRSYFDVLNELEKDKDKLEFLMSIINKQFLDEDPKDLNFIVNLCYSSQKHQIESSVKGWKRVFKTEGMTDPSIDPPTNPPTLPMTDPQEEEEKEKEKVEYTINKIHKFEKEDFKKELFQFIKDKIEENKLDFKLTMAEAGDAYQYYKDLKWKNSNNKVIANLKTTIYNNWIKKDLDKFRKEAKDGWLY